MKFVGGIRARALVMFAVLGLWAPSDRAGSSVQRDSTWWAGDVRVEVIRANAAPDVTALRLVIPTGTLNEAAANCGDAHLIEHLIGSGIASHDDELRAYGYRIDGFTGPDRIVISIDVGGGAEGLAAAMRTLSGALLGHRQTRELIAREQRLIAEEGKAGSPLAHPDSPAAFVAPDHRPNVTGQCKPALSASSMPPLPGFEGETRLLVFSTLSEAEIRQVVSPITLPPRVPGASTPMWRGERRTVIASDRLPRGQAAIVTFVKRGSATDWFGHRILWEFVRGAMAGSRVTAASFGEASLARLQGPGQAEELLRIALEQVRAVAADEADPRKVEAAAQAVRQDLCRRGDLRRALPLSLLARQLALDSAAEIEERLAPEICGGRSWVQPATAIARSAAEHFLAEGMFSTVEAAVPARVVRAPAAMMLQACADDTLPSETLEAMAMMVERKLGYALRFDDGIALRLGVTPDTMSGRSCLALRIDGSLVGAAQMRVAIQRLFARTQTRDDTTQLCFDARIGAADGRRRLPVTYAALAPTACIDAVGKLQLDRLLPAMRVQS